MHIGHSLALTRQYLSGGGSFSPNSLSNVIQFVNGLEYSTSTLAYYPYLASSKTGETAAVPRGQRCYSFDGTDDYGTVFSVPTIKTFSCWAKASSVTGTTRIVSCMFGLSGNDLSILNTNGTVELYIGNVAVSGSTTLTAGVATHFCASWDGTTGKLYKDGAEVISGTCVPISGTGQLVLGAWVTGTTQFFNGKIWDARIYSSVKTASEVQAIYNQHLTPTTVDTTSILAHWPCQEESGTVGYDVSGNGNHLTLNNITPSTFHATDTGVKWSYPNEKGYSPILNSEGAVLTLPTQSATQTAGTLVLDVVFTNTSIFNLWYVNGTYIQFDGSVLQRYNGAWSSFPSAQTLVANTAYTIAFVWTGSNITAYVNGVSQGTLSGASFLQNGQASIVLSRPENFAGFTGNIYEMRIYSSQLTASETLRANWPSTNLISKWGAASFQNSNGTVFYDEVGQNTITASGTGTPRKVIIPARSTTVDAGSGTLIYNGPIQLPITTEVPCVTGDGSATYVNLGSAYIPATADFSCTIRYYHGTNTGQQGILQQTDGSSATRWFFAGNMDTGGGSTAGALAWISGSGGNVQILGCLTVGAWHTVTLSRVGSTLTIGCNGVTASSTVAFSLLQFATELLRFASGSSSSRVCDLQITTGGVTTYFPLQDGPGSSNTNRNVAYAKTDGTGGVISNAIINGTVSSIWANRCPIAKDWSIQYGGRITTQNKIPSSDDFSAWSATVASVSTNTTTAPDGTSSADTLQLGAGTIQKYITIDTAESSLYTCIVYGKANTHSIIQILNPGSAALFANFDLANGVVGDVGANSTATIVAVGSGWYRCAVTFRSGPFSTSTWIVGGSTNTGSGYYPATSSTGNLYLWRARIKAGVDDWSGSIVIDNKTSGAAVDGNTFVAGLTGVNAADSYAKTLSAGKIGNPYTRVLPNLWGAPSLNNINYTSSMKLEEWPCVTGDGSAVSVAAGSHLPATADFTAGFWYYYASHPTQQTIFSQGTFQVYTSGAGNQLALYNGSAGTSMVAIPADQWSYVEVGRSGANWFIRINGSANATVAAVSIGGTNTTLLALEAGPAQQASGRISDLQITTGGVTKNFPLSEGSGRDIVYYVNGAETILSNAVVGGTLSAIWANKTNGLFSPVYAPQAMLPRNTKFRRTKTDGNDRYFAVHTALTGGDLTNANTYVS